MNAGILNKRIIIQANTSTRSASGEEDPIWSAVATIWASAEPLRGQEYLEANRLQADLDIRFRVRYSSAYVIKPSMRVAYNGRYFNIVSVINVKEKMDEVQLMCKELLEE
jgi:SPP1 family predicted phage head-tail adaptor